VTNLLDKEGDMNVDAEGGHSSWGDFVTT